MNVREFLVDYNKRKGFGVDDSDLIEALQEDAEEVCRSGRDVHRWFICEQVIVKIEDTFIQYTDYLITGVGCMSDMGLEYDLDKAFFVCRKERVVTEVYYE